MTPQASPTAPLTSGLAEPQAARRAVPVWLFVLLFLLLWWGMVSFDLNGGWFNPEVYAPYRSFDEVRDLQPVIEGPDPNAGRVVFERICALCHNADGAGKPGQAPPLAGSDWVIAAGPSRVIRIPVLGLTGPIVVSGKPYDFPAGMTPIAPTRDMMSDEMLANVLTYIRGAWGNHASPVTVDQVAAVRNELGTRATQATVKELLSLPETK